MAGVFKIRFIYYLTEIKITKRNVILSALVMK